MRGTAALVNPKLDAINDVDIDGSSRFKYILCKVYDNDNRNDFKYIVRGTASAEYHCEYSSSGDVNVKYLYCSFQHRERKISFGYIVLPVHNI